MCSFFGIFLQFQFWLPHFLPWVLTNFGGDILQWMGSPLLSKKWQVVAASLQGAPESQSQNAFFGP